MVLSIGMLNEFEAYLVKEEKSRVSVEKYVRDVRAFAEFAAEREISKEIAIAYKDHLQQKKYAVSSINSMLASINSFLKYKGLSECCVKQLKVQREVYHPKEKELTKPEYVRLVNAAKRKKNKRLSLLIQTIGSTGIRVSELRYFTVEAVTGGRVVVNCKNKNRIVLVPDRLKQLLLDYCRKEGITMGAIFVTKNGNPMDRSNIWRELKELGHRARVDAQKIFPHNLRKLFAKLFYKIEKDIAKLADILGHSSINTTRIYIATSGEEHMKQIEQLGLVL